MGFLQDTAVPSGHRQCAHTLQSVAVLAQAQASPSRLQAQGVMPGQPLRPGCNEKKVSRLRAQDMLIKWQADEGYKWDWVTPEQAYFKLCWSCHLVAWPLDMRSRNQHNKPGTYYWCKELGGRSRLLAGDLYISEAPPELLAPRSVASVAGPSGFSGAARSRSPRRNANPRPGPQPAPSLSRESSSSSSSSSASSKILRAARPATRRATRRAARQAARRATRAAALAMRPLAQPRCVQNKEPRWAQRLTTVNTRLTYG